MPEGGSGLQGVIIMMTLVGSPVVGLPLWCMFKGKRGGRVLMLFGVSTAILLAFALYNYSRSCAPDVIRRAEEADHASCAIGAFSWGPFILVVAAIAAVILLGVWERVEEVISKRRG